MPLSIGGMPEGGQMGTQARRGPSLIEGQWIDPTTGEISRTPPIMVAPRPRRWPEESVVVWQDAAKAIAKHPELGGEAIRVWLYIVGSVGYENVLALSHGAIGDELGMARPNVSRAIGKLIEAGILVEHGRFGRRRTYVLNSKVGWRGSIQQLRKHRAQKGGKEPKLRVLEGGKGSTENNRVEDSRQPDLLP